MDIEEFKSRLLLSRTWDVDKTAEVRDADGKVTREAEPLGAKFTLRMPSDQNMQAAYARHSANDDELKPGEWYAFLLEVAQLALINWQGVHGRMLDPGGKFDGEVPYEDTFARYLLEGNITIASALGSSVLARRNERDKKRAEDQKNSGRVSSTSEA